MNNNAYTESFLPLKCCAYEISDLLQIGLTNNLNTQKISSSNRVFRMLYSFLHPSNPHDQIIRPNELLHIFQTPKYGRSSLSNENDHRYFLNIGCSYVLVSSLMAD